MSDTTPPPDRLEVTYKGEPKELFMSYLRLNSCQRVLGGPDRVAFMMIDPDLSEGLIRVMLAEKGGAGAMFDVELADDDLTPTDFDRILLWVQEHLTAFFVKRLKAASQNVEALAGTIEALKLSAPGSPS